EKQLGHPYPELIDRLAGGGMALGVEFSAKPIRTVLAIQAKDRELMQKFAKLALDIAEQELGPQEVQGALQKETTRGKRGGGVAGEGAAVLVDGPRLVATAGRALPASMDALLDGDKKSAGASGALTAARKQLPDEPLAWTWLNLATVREIPQVKAAYDAFSLD